MFYINKSIDPIMSFWTHALFSAADINDIYRYSHQQNHIKKLSLLQKPIISKNDSNFCSPKRSLFNIVSLHKGHNDKTYTINLHNYFYYLMIQNFQ